MRMRKLGATGRPLSKSMLAFPAVESQGDGRKGQRMANACLRVLLQLR
jgi:hypothetical protein